MHWSTSCASSRPNRYHASNNRGSTCSCRSCPTQQQARSSASSCANSCARVELSTLYLVLCSDDQVQRTKYYVQNRCRVSRKLTRLISLASVVDRRIRRGCTCAASRREMRSSPSGNRAKSTRHLTAC